MDAYIFAESANEAAISSLHDLVGSSVRVVLPTSESGSDYAVYVAVDGDAVTLAARIVTVNNTSGLSGVVTYISAPPEIPENWPGGWPPILFPTHASVDDYLGFALLTCSPGSYRDVLIAASEITGVSGGTVVIGGDANVLVEATASTAGAVQDILDDVNAISGVTSASTLFAIGATASGYGFTHI